MDMLCKAIHLGAEISFAYYCNEVGLSDGTKAALVRRPLVPAARATHLPRDVGICNEAPPPRASIASGARYSLRTEMKDDSR